MRGPDIPVWEPRVFQQEGAPSPEAPGPPKGELRNQEEGRQLGRRSVAWDCPVLAEPRGRALQAWSSAGKPLQPLLRPKTKPASGLGKAWQRFPC